MSKDHKKIEDSSGADASALRFTFLTNHSHVLICLARDPNAIIRDVATKVGITERAVLAIVHDLVLAGVLTKNKVGRRNQYSVNRSVLLRHPVERPKTVGDLLRAVSDN